MLIGAEQSGHETDQREIQEDEGEKQGILGNPTGYEEPVYAPGSLSRAERGDADDEMAAEAAAREEQKAEKVEAPMSDETTVGEPKPKVMAPRAEVVEEATPEEPDLLDSRPEEAEAVHQKHQKSVNMEKKRTRGTGQRRATANIERSSRYDTHHLAIIFAGQAHGHGFWFFDLQDAVVIRRQLGR